MSDDVTDLTRGVYRRLYAGFVRGRRINSVSLMTEAWFWRVHAAADDFGNLDGDPVLCHAATAGLRGAEVSTGKVETFIKEMVDNRLLRRYEVGKENFLHIIGFSGRQPAGKNGKRVRRVPPSPWDESEDGGGIRVNPDSSSASDNHYHNHSDNHSNLSTKGSAEPAKRTSAVHPEPPSESFLEFPTVAGRANKSDSWQLTVAHADELAEAFPGVDVRGEARRALEWVRGKPANRKTAGGMRDFLFRWMSRCQDKGGSRSGPAAPRERRSIAATQVIGEV